MKVSTICLSKFMTAWHEKQSLDTMDNLDANDQFFIVCRYSLKNGMWFHFSSLGVCCPVLGERFSCQRSTRDKPVADVYQFVALVKLNRKTDAESRLSWERGNCCGFFVSLRMTEFWVCFSCCIAEQPQPVSMRLTWKTNQLTQLFHIAALFKVEVGMNCDFRQLFLEYKSINGAVFSCLM